MILVPVAEPYHLDLFFGAETEEPFPTRCGIDQNARTFNIEGVAVRVAAPVFAGKEADWTKYSIFH
jgi:hypothetical protein